MKLNSNRWGGSITPTDNFSDYNFEFNTKNIFPRGKSVSSNSMRRKINKRVTFAANDQIFLFDKMKFWNNERNKIQKDDYQIISTDPLWRAVRRRKI